jgi:curved DNA-binding protein CbpA
MDSFYTYYNVLGVSEKTTTEDIKTAYRKLSKLYHPDLNGGDRSFEVKLKQVEKAYQILSDPKERKKYDISILKLKENSGDSEPKLKFDPITEFLFTVRQFMKDTLEFMKIQPLVIQYGVVVLSVILLGRACCQISPETSQSIAINEIEPTVAKSDFVYPQWLEDSNFETFFLNKSTEKQLADLSIFLVKNPTYSCRLNGYFADTEDMILTKKRINAIRISIFAVLNENQVELNLKQVPVVVESKQDPKTKDILVELIDKEDNVVLSK